MEGRAKIALTSIQPTAEGWNRRGPDRSPGAHGIDGWVLRVDRVGKE
jgi:hypothetical protein